MILDHLTEARVTFDGRMPTGRLLERLSHEGMLDDEEPTETTIRRLRELSVLGYGTGKSADRAARILLTRGLPCPLARAAILRGLGLKAEALLSGTFDPEMILPALRECLDEAGLEADDVAAGIAEALHPAPRQSPAERWAFTWLDSFSTTSPSGRFDYAGAMVAPAGETTEQHQHSHARTTIEALLGKEVTDTCLYGEVHDKYNTRGKYALAEMSFDEDDEARQWLGIVPNVFPRALRLAADAPLPMLTGAARMVRPMLGLITRFSDEDADDLAACMAPATLATLESGAKAGIEGVASMAVGLISGMAGGTSPEPTSA